MRLIKKTKEDTYIILIKNAVLCQAKDIIRQLSMKKESPSPPKSGLH